jgi:Fuc2NAc and GlcNAc transferase
MNLCWAFLLGLVISYPAGFVARAVLNRFAVIDLPNERSSHDKPIVRGGGVALLFAAAVASYLSAPLGEVPRFYWVALAALVLAFVSFLDDVRTVPQSVRFGVQAAAAIVALSAFGFVGSAQLQPWMTEVLAVLGFFWIVGYSNAFNFMDGINGIAGMQVVTTGVGMGVVALAAGANKEDPAVILSFALAGAGAGFLPHNFPRARMFLGDVGSVTLGFLLSVLAFWLARDLGWHLLGAFGLLHANFVLDTAITLARRIARGEKFLESHRDHFYQLLLRSGKSHAYVTGCEGLLQAVVLVVMLASLRMGWPGRIGSVVAICGIWLSFFAYAERSFRRRPAAAAAPSPQT